MKIRGSEKKGLIVGIFLTIGLSAVHVLSQTGPLTYPQILTALNAKLPVGVTRTKLLSKLVTDVKSRKVDKPLTSDREDDLRQAGATDELIDAIRINSPLNPTKVETAERVDQKTDLAAADLLRWRESLRRRQGASVLAELSSVLNRDATNTQALWLRSTAYAQTRQFDKAEMDSRAVVNLLKLPKTAGDYGALCFATVSLQLWADSPANCNKAAELDPGFPEAHLGLGINRWVGKQFDLAIAEFTKAIGFDSRYAAAYFNRARAYQSKQQPDFAIISYMRRMTIVLQGAGQMAGQSHFIFDNKDAGKKLNTMLAMGLSRPWPEALEAITGQKQMDATAILDYFAPLKKWLDEQNKGKPVGW